MSFEIDTPCVIALGTFDGMHPGHLAVIDRAVCAARARGVIARAYTFYENPRSLFGGAPMALMTPEEKADAMRARGIDDVRMVHFTRELAQMEPRAFAEMLSRDYGAVAVTAGEDYCFGSRASGNVEMLRAFGAEMGFEVLVVDTVRIHTRNGEAAEKVSSTAIRNAIQSNRPDIAEALMKGETVSE